MSIRNGGLPHAKTITKLLKEIIIAFKNKLRDLARKKNKNQTFESFIDSEFQIKQIFFCLIYSGKNENFCF